MYELQVESDFSAAHNLRYYEGNCERLHGHNWRVRVSLKSEKLDSLGMVIDFKDIKSALKETLERFDHQYLNDLPCFKDVNPTTENLSRIIYENMEKSLPDGVFMGSVTTWESEKCSATYSKQTIESGAANDV